MKAYFLPEDLEDLDGQIAELNDQARQHGSDIGASCTQGAETYHDNAPYEEATRHFDFYSKRLLELVKVRQNAIIVQDAPNQGRVALGRSVRFVNTETGKESEQVIGSYRTFRDGRISYHSPLAKLLMSAVEGEERTGDVNGKKISIKVLEIK